MFIFFILFCSTHTKVVPYIRFVTVINPDDSYLAEITDASSFPHIFAQH